MMTNGRKYDLEAIYEIRVAGSLDPSWSEWFDGFTITPHNDETLLAGLVTDQAALLGLLAKLSQLNLTLLSMDRLESQGA